VPPAKLALNRTGRRLLAQFRTLNVTLTLLQSTSGRQAKPVRTRRIKFKAAAKKH
jgi:hypothetical protein